MSRPTLLSLPTRAHSASAARALAVLVLAALFAGVLALAAPPARAHDVLLESSPADEETLDSSPSSIVLTYNNNPLDQNPVISVTDEAGEEVAEGAPAVEGTDVSLDLPELDAGTYDVFWRVVSSDGHPIEGDFTFTVEAAAQEETAPEPEETTEPEAAEPAPEPTDEAADDADELASEEEGASWALWGGVAAVAVVVGVLIAVVRNRKQQ